METLLALLTTLQLLSAELATHHENTLTRKKIKEEEIVQFPGQQVSLMYFIDSGLLKSCRYDVNLKIYTWFQHGGNIVMSIPSRHRETSTNEYIVAIEDPVVYDLTKEQLNNTYKLFPEFIKSRRLLTERYYLMIRDWLVLYG